MTNFDPGGLLLLLTVIPAIVAGSVSIGMAKLVAWLGYGAYETNVLACLVAMIVGWIAASLVISTAMLQILAVTLAMVGAYAVSRSITATSYGWVLGVVFLFGAFIGLSALGIYEGVDRTGRPQGIIAQHFYWFYGVGLFVFGALGGKVVQTFDRRVRAVLD